ncbi:MAG: pyridoxal phosphate-dependent aminotransferase [Deltaproteobacteria bacterium]|nr:pyridoxal phosphate-dependent aminotransferase [Deltaproteobacteria bacterium]
MDILEEAQAMERKGRKVIHLEVGQPDFPTPPAVRKAGIEAIRAGKTHYTHSLGLLQLREAICEWYEKTYGVSVTPGRVLVSPGTSPVMLLLFSLLLDPGDEVILGNPYYACYPNYIRIFRGVPKFIMTREEAGFQLTAEAVRERISPKTRAILINSPSNPAGTLIPEKEMQAIAELGPPVISDEIYHGLVYEGRAHSILEYTDRAIVINGFSKRYAMTGWRLGYAILPEAMVRPLQRLQQNFIISASDFVQWAGITALKETGKQCAEMVRTYDERRRFMIRRLREIGFGVAVEPTGAFYILANARRFSDDSHALALELLRKTGVAVTPGIDFGENAEGYLRFSYAGSLEVIGAGLDRIDAYLREGKES